MSIPALPPCFSQMISLKNNGKLWLVSCARAFADSLFPNVNILVSLLLNDSLIWWGKCPNKDKGTINCFKSCRRKNVEGRGRSTAFPCSLHFICCSVLGTDTGHLGVMSSSSFSSVNVHMCTRSWGFNCQYGEGLSMRWLMKDSKWDFLVSPQARAWNVSLGEHLEILS